jgi:hypothetical protein
MDARRRRQTTCLPIILALLLVATLDPRSGLAAALPPPPAGSAGALRLAADKGAPADAPLSAGQLAKIRAFIDEKHRDAAIDPQVAKLLGLGKDGERVMVQQVSLIDKDKQERHIFDRLQDGSGFLVGKRSAEGLAVYRLGNDLGWIASVLWRRDGNKVALRGTDSETALRQELELWARFAEQRK